MNKQQKLDEKTCLNLAVYALERQERYLAKYSDDQLKVFFADDWLKLSALLDEIPEQPMKRLNVSYEKSKAFARTIRATHNMEQAILAARNAYDAAKSWNEFLDKKEAEQAPALLPAKSPKALAIGASEKA